SSRDRQADSLPGSREPDSPSREAPPPSPLGGLRLLSLRTIEVDGASEEDVRALAHRLRESRVRVDRVGEIVRDGSHLDREDALGDELSRARADDADAQDSLGLRIEDDLRQALGAPERERATRHRPREAADADLDALRAGLLLLESAPRD